MSVPMTLLQSLFQKSEDLKVIEFLYDSNASWTLTGSRAFGGARENSDWDFFADYSPGLALELEDYGFQRSRAYQGDQDIDVVYRLGSIDLQLVRDAKLKLKLQEQIKRTVSLETLSHAQRKEIWRLAYAVLTIERT